MYCPRVAPVHSTYAGEDACSTGTANCALTWHDLPHLIAAQPPHAAACARLQHCDSAHNELSGQTDADSCLGWSRFQGNGEPPPPQAPAPQRSPSPYSQLRLAQPHDPAGSACPQCTQPSTLWYKERLRVAKRRAGADSCANLSAATTQPPRVCQTGAAVKDVGAGSEGLAFGADAFRTPEQSHEAELPCNTDAMGAASPSGRRGPPEAHPMPRPNPKNTTLPHDRQQRSPSSGSERSSRNPSWADAGPAPQPPWRRERWLSNADSAICSLGCAPTQAVTSSDGAPKT